MDTYKHVLLAADYSKHGSEVAKRAKDVVDLNQAKLSIIHVVDYLPISDSAYGPVIPFDVDLAQELTAAAQKRLEELGRQLEVAEDSLVMEMGSPKLEIIRVAEEIGADLIVVGSHGRHGLALLLGSTANGVLHHATCDVLAVRLKDD